MIVIRNMGLILLLGFFIPLVISFAFAFMMGMTGAFKGAEQRDLGLLYCSIFFALIAFLGAKLALWVIKKLNARC